MVDHIVELVEKKAAEIEAAKAAERDADDRPPRSSSASDLRRRSSSRRFPVSKLQPVRGTHDLLPDEYRRFAHVIDTARDVARLYGYREMATPIFEFTELFARGIGETTDVVSKEMYTFEDRGGESLTLRPEYTAGICRAFVSNGELAQQLPLKIFAAGPMFRYERPQKGRQRQFHQIDLEVLGAPEPGADIEVISVAADILDRLGILDRCVLKLNSLGDPREPRRLSQGAGRLLLGAHRQALRGLARAPAAQSAAHPRQQGRGRQGDQRRRAVLRRPPEPGEPRLLRGGAGRPRGRRHRRSRSIPAWCAASTTTPTPPSSS